MVALVEGGEDALVGDVIFAQGIGRTDFPRSDHAAMMRSLDRIFAEVPRETASTRATARGGSRSARPSPTRGCS